MKLPGWLVWPVLMMVPGAASAHSPIPGIKGFYTGLLHPLTTPAQMLLLLGLGLLIAGFAVQMVRWHLLAYLAATLVGAIAAAGLDDVDTGLFTIAMAACALAALVPGKFAPVVFLTAAVGGVLMGVEAMPDPGPTRDRIITLSGSLIGANLLLLYLFGAVHFVKQRYGQAWVRIAFRIAAAWIGAISMVMLALRFAPQAASL